MQTQTRTINEFGNLTLCAIRHCSDRVDAVPVRVINAIKENWLFIDKNHRVSIKKDVAYAVDNKIVGMDYDTKLWISFWDWIAENQKVASSNEPITQAFDIGFLTVNALRYCFGRSTAMPSLIINATKENWSFIPKRERALILKDLAFAFQTRSMGNAYEKKSWLNFYDWVIDQISDEIIG